MRYRFPYSCWICITIWTFSASAQKTLTPRDLFYAEDPRDNPAAPGNQPSPGAALGMRYGLLHRQADGHFVGVDPDNVAFRPGDQVKITLQANQNSYVYIVQRGSSGKWSLLFPSPHIEDGNNLILAFHSVELPSASDRGFTFDDRPGVENVLLIASRIYFDAAKLIASMNADRDAADGRLIAEAARPRDLVVESAEEEIAGKQKGLFRYAVNTTGVANPYLVVRLNLKHTAAAR